MKTKTSSLTGTALDWAVAKCEGDDTLAVYFDERSGEPLCHDDWPDNQEFKPSTDWAQGGPIIEREGVQLRCGLGGWVALPYDSAFSEEAYQEGDTPLVAAMRCYVASKLGDEVEVPNELA
jgi:hypothetical protein